MGGYAGGGPGNLLIATSGSAANIGSTFKAAQKDTFLLSKQLLIAAPGGLMPPTTTNFIDLDPHYNDMYGDPLPRVTMDYTSNGTNSSNYLANYWVDIMTKMGATNVTLGTAAVAGTNPAHLLEYTYPRRCKDRFQCKYFSIQPMAAMLDRSQSLRWRRDNRYGRE